MPRWSPWRMPDERGRIFGRALYRLRAFATKYGERGAEENRHHAGERAKWKARLQRRVVLRILFRRLSRSAMWPRRTPTVGHFGEAREHALRIRDARGAERCAGGARSAASGARRRCGCGVRHQIDRRSIRASPALARVAAVTLRFGKEDAGRALFAQSIALADRAGGPAERRAFTFIRIARAQISAGEVVAARGTLQRASAAQASVTRAGGRWTLLQQIAALQARIGDHATRRYRPRGAWTTQVFVPC